MGLRSDKINLIWAAPASPFDLKRKKMQQQNYFKVDPNRHSKNKLEKLSKLSINPYTGQIIQKELHVRTVSQTIDPKIT